jgi:hypothetical protein
MMGLLSDRADAVWVWTPAYAQQERPEGESSARASKQNASGRASLAVNAVGAVRLKTTPLLTAEEMGQADKKGVKYRPPGA